MPDDDFDSDDEPQETAKGLRASLEAANRAKAEAEQALSKVQRENAFLQAKLPETPQIKFFQEHYAGEPTAEAIRSAATTAGFLDTGPPASELNTLERIEETVRGAPTLAPGGREAMYEEMREKARSPEDVAAIMRKYGAPVAGDRD